MDIYAETPLRKAFSVIRFELQAKHIGQDVIDLAVEDSDISDESDRITHILQKNTLWKN